jgi:hypothetical protein
MNGAENSLTFPHDRKRFGDWSNSPLRLAGKANRADDPDQPHNQATQTAAGALPCLPPWHVGVVVTAPIGAVDSVRGRTEKRFREGTVLSA